MPAKQASKSGLEVVNNTKANAAEFSTEQLKHVYHEMLYIRRFQEKTATLYQQGTMGGFCHLYTGQEAVVMGAIEASNKSGDEFITTYRCHAHALALGVPAGDILAELMGKATGISKGKGGSMHMFDPEKHFWGGHGIVGGNIPLGTGMAFAKKYRGQDDLVMTFFGDGASDNGAMYESFNMAALWKLPVIYIIENNRYSMGTAKERHSAGELYKRGEPFGIPGEKVDGMNFFSVYEAIKKAADHIRSGKGPYLLEMDTYRYRGHSMSDPAKYRTKDEVNDIKTMRDPVESMKKYLIDDRKVSEDELKEMDKSIKAKVTEAEKFATESPKADMAELYTDITLENGKEYKF